MKPTIPLCGACCKLVMAQEDKELLIKDLCARLPYDVIVDYAHNAFDVRNGYYMKHESKCILSCYLLDVFISPRQNEEGEYIKPYLFPLSNMTDEQKQEYQYITERWMYDSSYSIGDSIDWLNKNHFDYRGLIEKGLAIDANGLNIY